LKIALCISGQLRTFERCYNNLRRYIIDPLSPDIFVHIWRNSGVSQHLDSSTSRNFAPAQFDINTERLKALYSPIKTEIENSNDEGTESLCGIEVPYLLKVWEPNHYKGSLPMFYKIKKCNELKCDWEKNNGLTYDFVIRMRPDLMIEQFLPDKVFTDSNTIWFADYALDPEHQVSDKFALGSSDLMDHYSSVWDNLRDYWKTPLGQGDWNSHRVGERLLKYHLKQKQINVSPFTLQCYIEKHSTRNRFTQMIKSYFSKRQ